MLTTRYYYERLNQREKRIYKAIYECIMKYKPFVDVPESNLDEKTVGWIYHCILWDNPYIFSVGEYAMWHALSADKSRIKMTTLCDSASEKKYRKQIEDIVNQILATPGLQNMSDFQKEVFVHNFIINNVEYDKTLGDNGSKIQPYTVYGALIEHKAVCEGIAKTVKLLLNLLDVKCIVVSGTYDGHGHAWNMVKLGDWSYNLDVTMDMGQVIHKKMMRYNHFNFRDGDITNYKLDNPYLLPECRAIENNYIIKAGGFVSCYERLKNYIKRELSRQKPCLYFKINRNVNDQYTNISFKKFIQEVDRAFVEVSKQMGINSKRYVDTSGPGEIINMEITYLG